MPCIETISTSELPLVLEVPDALFTPSFMAFGAYRLRSFRDCARACNPNVLREPFQTLAEVLHIPGRFATTVRIGIRGTAAEPTVESDVVVVGVGDGDIFGEVDAAARQVEAHLGGDHAPFVLSPMTRASLAWPTDGNAAFIRQQLLRVGTADNSRELPLRFSFPGPDAPYRLLTSLMASGPGTDLMISITPTTLWADERDRLDAAQVTSRDAAENVTLMRDSATALDACLSYHTDLYVLQVLLVRDEPLREVAIRAVGSALTAGYDAERMPGSRVVARPNRFLGGGFEIEPCRDSATVLRWLSYGAPWIGFRGRRELVDLVTSTEVGYTFAWLADRDGRLPGIATQAAAAPPVPKMPGWVRLGSDMFGTEVRLADVDRHLHTVFLGATGCGKTTLMVDLALQDARAGRTVVVIDPHGDMNERIVDALPQRSRPKTYYLDASTGKMDHVDLLRLYEPGTDKQKAISFALVDGMIADLNPDFAGPVFVRVMRRLVHLASLTDGTMLDIEHYLANPSDLRRAAARAGGRELNELAGEVANWSSDHRAEMTTYVAGKLEWLSSSGLNATFGRRSSSFDLPRALEDGAIILVNPGADFSSGGIAMSTFLEALLCCLTTRRAGAPTIGLYLDEVQRYCGNVLRRVSNELRKRSVAVHAATQNVTNLGQHLEALVGNAGNLIVGRCNGPTANLAASVVDVPRTTMAALPNFVAVARLTTDGSPSSAFNLRIDTPTGKPPVGVPRWLTTQSGTRRRADSPPKGDTSCGTKPASNE
jgi:Type IV secretion-system coupling protein DNA-binding domain